MELEGKVALVTGAAGAGIGQATARALAEAGADVVVTDAHPRRTEQVAADLAAATGRRVVGLPLDVTDEARVSAVVTETVERFGHLDVLVNNSGINELKPVWEMPTESWRKVIDVCLTGHFFLIRAVLPHMMARGGGSIINISSVAGWMGTTEGEAHYAAAKAGVMGLTRAVAAEVARHGIRVNAIAPGLIWNEFLARIYPPQFFTEMEAKTPIGRVGRPEDIANTVVFLAGDRSSFMTGEVMCVSGGLYNHA